MFLACSDWSNISPGLLSKIVSYRKLRAIWKCPDTVQGSRTEEEAAEKNSENLRLVRWFYRISMHILRSSLRVQGVGVGHDEVTSFCGGQWSGILNNCAVPGNFDLAVALRGINA